MSSYTHIPTRTSESLTALEAQLGDTGEVLSYSLAHPDQPEKIVMSNMSQPQVVAYVDQDRGWWIIRVTVERASDRAQFTGSYADAIAFCKSEVAQ